MNKTIFAAVLVAACFSGAFAQDPQTQLGMSEDWNAPKTHLRFCPSRTCLYYAGDSGSNANGLFNADSEGLGIDAQVWVGVKPTENATVTGATFNQLFTAKGVGTNPTPFAIQVGITKGHAGKTVCSTGGTATETRYGEPEFGFTQYSYTVKKFSKPCKLKKGTLYYVNLLPRFSGITEGYVVNVGPKARNHRGWPNQPDKCFFNSKSLGERYQPCSKRGAGLELSIALTGEEKK